VFSEIGVEAATIGDITDLADVGRGTFYTFFDTKEALADEIVFEAIREITRQDQIIQERYNDVALILAVVLQSSWRVFLLDPLFGSYLHRARPLEMMKVLRDRIATLIARGCSEGRFSVSNVELAVAMTFGITLGVLEDLLDGRLDDSVGALWLEECLRILGLSRSQARGLAHRAEQEVGDGTT
jgi:AcrR family transcriptional regulator